MSTTGDSRSFLPLRYFEDAELIERADLAGYRFESEREAGWAFLDSCLLRLIRIRSTEGPTSERYRIQRVNLACGVCHYLFRFVCVSSSEHAKIWDLHKSSYINGDCCCRCSAAVVSWSSGPTGKLCDQVHQPDTKFTAVEWCTMHRRSQQLPQVEHKYKETIRGLAMRRKFKYKFCNFRNQCAAAVSHPHPDGIIESWRNLWPKPKVLPFNSRSPTYLPPLTPPPSPHSSSSSMPSQISCVRRWISNTS